MSAWLLGAGSALWLGLLTSISPCPLATNVAAISYLGRTAGAPRRVLAGGLAYTLGRALAYVALGLVLVWGLLAAPDVSFFLQDHMSRLLGPVLLVCALFLFGALRARLPGLGRLAERLQPRIERLGLAGAGLLGLLFALSFCPVSAALFFGSTLTIALGAGKGAPLPLLTYGLGTALPVVAFAVVIAFSAQRLGRVFDRVTAVERWLRIGTAVVFLVVGVFMTWRYTLGM